MKFLSILPSTRAALLTCAAVVALSAAPAVQQPSGAAARNLYVRIGKSLIVDSTVPIERVAMANPGVAEAVAVSPREVLVNGRGVGETSMIVWQETGNRMLFDLHVLPDTTFLTSIQEELAKEFGEDVIDISSEQGNVYLRGRVADLGQAQRAEMIASTLPGKLINLLHVDVPDVETQVLLKVRFANVDRVAFQELGANYLLAGALNTTGTVQTGQVGRASGNATGGAPDGGSATGTLSDILNIFVFRPDLNFGVAIRALQSKNLLQILAEPNVLAINGKSASFLAGGEFPFPVIQGGGFGGAVTIQFREFGVRINFTPRVTPRGTIRLEVEPEVSSLDFANGLQVQGGNIPAISTRRVTTEVELESNQSFAIGGLLDNRVTEQLSRIPGIGDIPFFGRLFRSREISRNRAELVVLVTPEIVRPIPEGSALPDIPMVKDPLPGGVTEMPRTPGLSETGPVPVEPAQQTMPVEQLRQIEQQQGNQQPVVLEPIQRPWVLPVGPVPVQQQPAQAAPAPAAAPTQ